MFSHTHHVQAPATQAIFSITLSVNFHVLKFKPPGGIQFKSSAKIVIITKAKCKKILILEGGSLPKWSQHRTCNLKSCSDYKMDLFHGGAVFKSKVILEN